MPTRTFEVTDYDVAVEPWSPIKRRIVLRAGADDGRRDEATLLFAPNRTETGVVTNLDGDEGVSVWAYFDADDYADVLHLLESQSAVYLHFGHVSGTAASRTLYFVSVETSASVPGDDDVGESLPFGAYAEDESLELPAEGDAEAEAEAVDRVERRTVERN